MGRWGLKGDEAHTLELKHGALPCQRDLAQVQQGHDAPLLPHVLLVVQILKGQVTQGCSCVAGDVGVGVAAQGNQARDAVVQSTQLGPVIRAAQSRRERGVRVTTATTRSLMVPTRQTRCRTRAAWE